MFIKPANRRYIKNSLLIANVALGVILICLLIFGLIVVRPKMVMQATHVAQYYLLDLNHLPQGLDTVEPDYIGQENEVASSEFDDGSKARNEVNVVTSAEDEAPKIAILITNLGLSKKINDLALRLPPQISFGVIPYSNNMQTFINDAQGKGHDIYISLPNFIVADGENHSSEGNSHRFNDWLNTYGKYKGLYSSHNIIDDNLYNFQNLLKQVEDKNLLFIMGAIADNATNSKSFSHKNIIHPQVMIGLEADEDDIRRDLEQIVKQAKINKKVIGYATGYLLTIDLIHKWLPTLRSQGIELVPLSSAVGW